MSRSVRLGPFDLVAPVAQGGSAVLWRAAHAASGMRTAIKVIPPGGRSDWLAAEVQVLARLRHPNVLGVFDVIEVTAAQARPDAGLPEGAVALAMEWMGGGDAGAMRHRATLDEVAELLVCVLEALGHAHAHRVLHLDVKAANVLLPGPADLRASPVLADFGIAHVLGTRRGMVAGSPGAMAPEQWRGQARFLGPWTDLFAVGRLARDLLSPAPEDASTVTFATVGSSEVEPGGAAAGPPPGSALDPWIAWLESPEPFRRPPTATAALRGLERALGRSPDPGRLDPPLQLRAPVRLLDTGLGLVSLRAPRTVGRATERERCWALFRDVLASGAARVLAIRGPAGSGKSHLAGWLCRAVEERGLGTVARCQADAAAPDRALAELLDDLVGYGTLGAARVRCRADLVARGDDVDELLGLDLSTTGNRVGALTSWARVWPEPLVLLVDDAHASADARSLARALVTGAADRPTLLVLTIEEDELGAPIGPDVVDVWVPPMPKEELAALLADCTELGAPTIDRIVASADGGPAAALELVASLASEGRIRPGPDGLEVAGPIARPKDRPDRWRGLTEDFLATCAEPEAAALALAALVGAFGPGWDAARAADGADGYALADVDVRALLARAERAGIVAHQSDTWQFVHASARAAAADALPSGVRSLHARCARVIADPRRRAIHAALSGAYEEAFPQLLAATEHALDRGEQTAVRHLLSLAASALEGLDVPASDVRRGQLRFAELLELRAWRPSELAAAGQALVADAGRYGWALVAASARRVLPFRDAAARKALLEEVLAVAHQHGATPLEARIRSDLGSILIEAPALAQEHLQIALDLHRENGDAVGQALALLRLAELLPFGERRGRQLEALACYQAASDWVGVGTVHTHFAAAALFVGDDRGALAALDLAEASHLRAGSNNLPLTRILRAWVLLRLGRVDEAAATSEQVALAVNPYLATLRAALRLAVAAELGDEARYRHLLPQYDGARAHLVSLDCLRRAAARWAGRGVEDLARLAGDAADREDAVLQRNRADWSRLARVGFDMPKR